MEKLADACLRLGRWLMRRNLGIYWGVQLVKIFVEGTAIDSSFKEVSQGSGHSSTDSLLFRIFHRIIQ